MAESNKMSVEEDPFGDNTNPQNVLRIKGNNLKKMRDDSLDAVKNKVNETAATLRQCGIHTKVFKASIAPMERAIVDFYNAFEIVYVRGGRYHMFLSSRRRTK